MFSGADVKMTKGTQVAQSGRRLEFIFLQGRIQPTKFQA